MIFESFSLKRNGTQIKKLKLVHYFFVYNSMQYFFLF